MRRLRASAGLRNLVRETRLSPANLVYPLFVCPGKGVRKEIRSMPGVFNLSVDETVKEAEAARSLGIPAIILFGLPESKDEQASGAWIDDSFKAGIKTVTIKAQGEAYFKLLAKHPELKDVFRLGNRLVWVTPSGTALIVDSGSGQDKLSDAEIDALFAMKK